MTAYPHTRSKFSGPLFSLCRCGASAVCWPDTTAVAPAEWGAGCPAAMRERIAELEAHEASIHKAVDRSRRGIARWLRRDLDRLWEWATNPRLTEHAQSVVIGAREALALASEGVAAGHDAEWCEANPETSPAPVGADAGRDPGSSEE